VKSGGELREKVADGHLSACHLGHAPGALAMS
jgi:hypothetical protein